ncbi:uncharacterized protein LOC105172173 [Sesamum indicum]|uniref:Uncharacterized protein LOC105172173 n=1 Tax=Sesamum indicum TaxID=4182 RepID=A0A6I9U2S7_SESIN|nr:uncharacterized protein LOC105172173 [Sesamum indicum]
MGHCWRHKSTSFPLQLHLTDNLIQERLKIISMAGRGAALVTQISTNCTSVSSPQRQRLGDSFVRVSLRPGTTSCQRISLVRASPEPQKGGGGDGAAANDEGIFVSQEDWQYLAKLGAGSVAGAAAIKYGSIVFPEITRPNLAQALLMISAPVVVAVWLLIKRSRLD